MTKHRLEGVWLAVGEIDTAVKHLEAAQNYLKVSVFYPPPGETPYAGQDVLNNLAAIRRWLSDARSDLTRREGDPRPPEFEEIPTEALGERGLVEEG